MNKKTNSEAEHYQITVERFDEWARTYGEDRIASWFRYYQAYALNNFNLLVTFKSYGTGRSKKAFSF
jgi:hypothetical protein